MDKNIDPGFYPTVQPYPSCGHCPTCGRGPGITYYGPWWGYNTVPTVLSSRTVPSTGVLGEGTVTFKPTL
jgi:hypothetical protein